MATTSLNSQSQAGNPAPGVRMVIYHSEHPDRRLVREQMNKLMFNLSIRIRDCTDSKCPTFDGVEYNNGCIFINSNDSSKTWLERTVPECSQKMKLPLKVMKVQPVLMEITLESFGMNQPESFLTLLKNQNPDLKTHEWRVVGKRKLGKKEEATVLLLVEMDDSSQRSIERINMEAYGGFHKAKFRIIDPSIAEKTKKKFRV